MTSGLRVLLVDDSPAIQRRLADLLSHVTGVERVIVARGCTDARNALRDADPGLVVLDIHLADANGIDCLREIKAVRPSTFVAVLTNYPLGPYRRACRDAGADVFLDKSNDVDRLVEIVAAVAHRAGGRR